jgi:predicted nuclease of predicted toxin-antitoxin system
MRVLLDECVPRRLRGEFAAHFVRTVVEMGWCGVKNGQLLARAAVEFDCFVTIDANLQFQQSLTVLPVSVVIIRSTNSRFETLQQLMPAVLRALNEIQPRQLRVVDA